jgi:hypothetical protein
LVNQIPWHNLPNLGKSLLQQVVQKTHLYENQQVTDSIAIRDADGQAHPDAKNLNYITT